MNWTVHIILLILGEIWNKASNLTSLLLIIIFAQVNAEALNIKSCQPRQNTAEKLPRQSIFSYSYLSILFAMAKNAEIRGLETCAKKLSQILANNINPRERRIGVRLSVRYCLKINEKQKGIWKNLTFSSD